MSGPCLLRFREPGLLGTYDDDEFGRLNVLIRKIANQFAVEHEETRKRFQGKMMSFSNERKKIVHRSVTAVKTTTSQSEDEKKHYEQDQSSESKKRKRDFADTTDKKKLKRQRCGREGCTTLAVGGGSIRNCTAHGGGKRCTEPDCEKSAVGKTDMCKAHGGGKRCASPGCTKTAQPCDKCMRHGGGKRCAVSDCKKFAIFGGAIKNCINHGGGRRCTQPDCEKSAQRKTDKCITHGGGNRCTEPNCKKSAPGMSDKCVGHGGGKRCTEPDCKRSAVTPSDKCKGHGGGHRCVSCAIFSVSKAGKKCSICDPNSRSGKKMIRKEIEIKNLLESEFPDVDIVHDKSIGTECGRYRPDFIIRLPTHSVVIECDEHAHDYYAIECEKAREFNIAQAEKQPTYFIRYNPDRFNGPDGKTMIVPKEERQKHLVAEVKEALKPKESWVFAVTVPCYVKHLFYNAK